MLLVEHVWAARCRRSSASAAASSLAQGMLTPEVMMIVGAELQAKADAEAAIELADAARGAALLEALATLTGEHAARGRVAARGRRRGRRARSSTRASSRRNEAHHAIAALAERGIVEQALLHGAVAEAEELLDALEDEPPPRDA